MPQLQRFFCSNCLRPIDEITIEGKPVPLVVYFVVGQPPDTGPPVDLDEGSGVKVPSFIREIMQPHVPTARVELCIPCVAEVFGTKLVTADADPMFSKEATRETARAISLRRVADDTARQNGERTRTSVEQHHDTVARVLQAVKVGRGALKAPKLPKPDPKPHAAPAPVIAATEPAGATGAATPPRSLGAARNRARKAAARPQVKHVTA
jgi:hypothetical protein